MKEAKLLRDEIEGLADRTALIQANLSDEADAQRAVATAANELGGLHFAVNLASGFPRTPLAELNEAVWERSMADAKASYLVTLHAARAMMANEGPTRGHIVLFSDWAALHAPYRGYLPYMTSKAAITFMTRAFASELAPSGILVNAIAPGPTMRPPDLHPTYWKQGAVDLAPLCPRVVGRRDRRDGGNAPQERDYHRRGHSRRLRKAPCRTGQVSAHRVTKTIEFCYGHRLLDYDGKVPLPARSQRSCRGRHRGRVP